MVGLSDGSHLAPGLHAMHRVAFLLALIAVSVSRPVVANDDVDARQVAALVQQLGHEVFEQREVAERELRSIGIPALPILLAARDSDPDAEIRRRAKLIVPGIEAADHAIRLQAFIQDIGSTGKATLPGWDRFRSLAGDSRETRKLFASMHEAEAKLMRQADASDDALSSAMEERLLELFQPVLRGSAQAYRQSLGSVAALLFLGSRRDLRLSETWANQVASLAQGPVVSSVMQSSDVRAESMRRLIGDWIAERSQGWTAMVNLHLAHRYQLREPGLKLAREMVQRPGAVPSLRGQALLLLERFGSDQDIEITEACLTDAGTCATFAQQKDRLTVEVREVALAVAVLLARQSPDQFGFSKLQRSGDQFLMINTLDVGKGTEIDRAIVKWNEYRQKTTTAKDKQPSKE